MDMFFALALLACPLGMGAMMWMMMRSNNHGPGSQSGAAGEDETTRLRAEVDQLRAAQREAETGGTTSGNDPMGPR